VKHKLQTKAAPKQTLLSLIILGVLAIIAGGVFTAQFSYFPAVQQLASELPAGDKMEPTLALAAEPALITPPAGQIPITPMEAFDAATLSDKINGKAELYLSAGFKRLHSQRLKTEKTGDVWMEVFVYDMQTPQNAFSVFSAQRREDAQTLDLGQYGYQTANAIFFVHGPFYVEIIASDPSEAIRQSMRTFAETFIASHAVQTQTIQEKALFPETGLIEDSISLVSADAFGYERFNRIFTATYQLEDTQLMAYFSRRESPGEAQELDGGYADFLMAFGGSAAESDLAIPSAKVIYILDTYEIVFSHGPYLAGVREAAAQQPAQDLALQLYNRIKEATRESDVRN
jgi:hypothetical protein